MDSFRQPCKQLAMAYQHYASSQHLRGLHSFDKVDSRHYDQRLFVRLSSSCTLGPLNIRALEIILGHASPCLMDLFTLKI
jgi:hypothetical protein